MQKIRALFVALVLLVALAACGSEATHMIVHENQKVTVNSNPTIIVESAAGSITTHAAQDGLVNIDIEKDASTMDDIKKMNITVTNDNNTVRIIYKRPLDSNIKASVAFTISAPAGSKLQLQTSGGAITSDNFTQGVTANTSGGAITTNNVKGDLALNTNGGNITVSGAEGSVNAGTNGGSITVKGTLRGTNMVKTSGGSITVTIPTSSSLWVRGSTSGGSVSNDFGLPITGSPGAGSFDGIIGSGNGSLSMETSGGSVSLHHS